MWGAWDLPYSPLGCVGTTTGSVDLTGTRGGRASNTVLALRRRRLLRLLSLLEVLSGVRLPPLLFRTVLDRGLERFPCNAYLLAATFSLKSVEYGALWTRRRLARALER